MTGESVQCAVVEGLMVESREEGSMDVVVVQCVRDWVNREDKGDWTALVNALWVDMVCQP
jgi:hypothetical protein